MVPKPKPSVGRIVHYGHEGIIDGQFYAAVALITHHGDDWVDLTIFPPGCQPITKTGIKYSEELKLDHWTWPPRV